MPVQAILCACRISNTRCFAKEGVDEGGVAKEYFRLLSEQLFSPAYGMFSVDSESRYLWFNPGRVNACMRERRRSPRPFAPAANPWPRLAAASTQRGSGYWGSSPSMHMSCHRRCLFSWYGGAGVEEEVEPCQMACDGKRATGMGDTLRCGLDAGCRAPLTYHPRRLPPTEA